MSFCPSASAAAVISQVRFYQHVLSLFPSLSHKGIDVGLQKYKYGNVLMILYSLPSPEHLTSLKNQNNISSPYFVYVYISTFRHTHTLNYS